MATRRAVTRGASSRASRPGQPTPPHFDLGDLSPWGSISPGMRDALLEAARVMLDRHHTPPTTRGTWAHQGLPQPIRVSWSRSTPDERQAHNNAKDATEDGAYALAVHAARSLGYQVIGRAPQGSGADWYMTDPKNNNALLKLEVSGIEQGGAPGSRLSAKVDQGKAGSVCLPGLAVVFRFQDAGCYSEAWP